MKALIVVDHGSKVAAANQMLDEVIELIRFKTSTDIMVEGAHMELAEPSIEQVVDKCVKAGATEIVVQPYMLSPGRHATKDIPQLASAAAAKHPHITLTTTQAFGVHPKIAETVLERSGLLEQTKTCPFMKIKRIFS